MPVVYIIIISSSVGGFIFLFLICFCICYKCKDKIFKPDEGYTSPNRNSKHTKHTKHSKHTKHEKYTEKKFSPVRDRKIKKIKVVSDFDRSLPVYNGT